MLSPGSSRTGGIAAHLNDLVDAMTEAQIDVTVAVVPLRPGGLHAAETPSTSGDDEVAPSSAALSAIEQLVADLGPQVIHVHCGLDRRFLAQLRRYAPVVQSVHSHYSCTHGLRYFKPGDECHRPHGPTCLANSVLRNCGHRRVPILPIDKYRQTGELLQSIRRADLVIAYSKYVASDLNINRVRDVTTLPLFVRDQAQTASVVPESDRVLFAGRVVREKGLDVLLRALVHVDATLEVRGDGWAMERCRRLSSKLRLDDRVQFAGWASETDMQEAYERCALVAVPSVYPEAFGLVGLEAMIHGRPVLASDTGGISEWLRDGVNGCLVPPGDPEALATALERLLDNPDERRDMGRRGREIALTEFSVEQHLRDLKSAYWTAIKRWKA